MLRLEAVVAEGCAEERSAGVAAGCGVRVPLTLSLPVALVFFATIGFSLLLHRARRQPVGLQTADADVRQLTRPRVAALVVRARSRSANTGPTEVGAEGAVLELLSATIVGMREPRLG